MTEIMNEQNIQLILTNQRSNPLTVLLEPWLDQKILEKGASLTINAVGPIQGFPEIEFEDDRVIFHGWAGSICEMIE